MIEEIDLKIAQLLKHRDKDDIKENPKLRALICSVVEKAYFLEYIILSDKKFTENSSNQFFSANTSVNRYFRDSGIDEVADIYNELRSIAEPYLQT